MKSIKKMKYSNGVKYVFGEVPVTGYTIDSTVTTGGSYAMNATSGVIQIFTGTQNLTVGLPDTMTIAAGYQYQFKNLSSGTIFVWAGGDSVVNLVDDSALFLTCVNNTVNNRTAWIEL